jgi:superfamily II DNA or RNA helicase
MLAKPSVTINVGHATSRIERGVLTPAATNAISEACAFEPAGAEFMARSKKYRNGWDGKRRLYHKGYRTFGTGLLPRIHDILREQGYEIHLDGPDAPDLSEYELPELPEQWTNHRQYQLDAVETMLQEKRGMVQIATGGGKTVVAGLVMKRLNVETIFFVHTKDLLFQALETFRSMFGDEWVGQVGDGVCDPRFITVCTLQTAARALDEKYEVDSFAEGTESWRDKTTPIEGIRTMLQSVQLVFMDECHRVAAPTAMSVVMNTPNAPWRYGLSASPWRDDGSDLALEAIFGRTIVKISASSLIEQGFLVRPIVRFKRVPPARFVKKTPYSTVYSEYVVNNEARNDLVVKDVSSKLRRGIQTLVLVREIAHGHHLAADRYLLRNDTDVPFISGEDDSDRHEPLVAARRDEVNSLASSRRQSQMRVSISNLLPGSFSRREERVLLARSSVSDAPYDLFAGKRFAEITDFEDNARFLLDHSNARMKIYESEPLFEVVDY